MKRIDGGGRSAATGVEESVREEAVRRGADLIVTRRGRSQGSFSAMLSRLYPIVRRALPRIERLKLRQLRCEAGLQPQRTYDDPTYPVSL